MEFFSPSPQFLRNHNIPALQRVKVYGWAFSLWPCLAPSVLFHHKVKSELLTGTDWLQFIPRCLFESKDWCLWIESHREADANAKTSWGMRASVTEMKSFWKDEGNTEAPACWDDLCSKKRKKVRGCLAKNRPQCWDCDETHNMWMPVLLPASAGTQVLFFCFFYYQWCFSDMYDLQHILTLVKHKPIGVDGAEAKFPR